MNFNEFQKTTRNRAYYPRIGKNLIYPALGIAGEAGEVADGVKKLVRDYGMKEGDSFKKIIKRIQKIKDKKKRHKGMKLLFNLRLEIGDVLWYCAALSAEMGEELNSIAEMNNIKLGLRHGRRKSK